MNIFEVENFDLIQLSISDSLNVKLNLSGNLIKLFFTASFIFTYILSYTYTIQEQKQINLLTSPHGDVISASQRL